MTRARWVAMLVAGCLLVGTALAGCRTGSGEDEGPMVLRCSLASDPVSLDPPVAVELFSEWIGRNLYEGLVRLRAGKVETALATAWRVNDDATIFTFTLRDNVRFHSGNPFTAEDVKFSWERGLRPETKAQGAPRYLAQIKGAAAMTKGEADSLSGVRVVDAHTLEVTLVTSFPEFIYELTWKPTYILDRLVVQAEDERWAERLSAGTGPFKLEEWEPNTRLVLVANPDYWGGKPALSRVEYNIVPQLETAMAMYEGGELDYVSVPAAHYDRVRKDPVLNRELRLEPRGQIQFIGMTSAVYPPFADVRVRKAFTMALNLEEYAAAVHQGRVDVARGMLPPAAIGHDPGLTGLPFDPATARELLAEAGYPGGKGLPPLQLTFFGDAQEAQWVVASLKDNLGLEVALQRLERTEFLAALNRRSVAFFLNGWTAGSLPRPYLYDLLYSRSSTNRSGYRNEALDELLDRAASTMDEAERLRLYRQADRLAVEDAALIWRWWPRWDYLVKPYVKGLTFDAIGPWELSPVEIER